MLKFSPFRHLAVGFALAVAAVFPAAAETLTVGVTGGPHAQIMEFVAKQAAKDGLTLKIVEFDDYQLPNAALASGDLDANSFQHQPFLDDQVAQRGLPLVSVAKTVIYPLGFYSKKVKALTDLKTGDKVAIPGDPTNGGRALLLLQAKGLIKLRADVGFKASPLDVTDNPRNLKFIELPAAQLPRSLDDVAVAAINSNYAIEVGMVPHKDALVLEDRDSPYANVIAVRKEDKDKPAIAKLVKAYQSDETRKFIVDKFGASVVPAF